MALQVPHYLKDRTPEFLHNVLESTYMRSSRYGNGDNPMTCSERSYDMKVCHGPERDGIRYGTFHSTNLSCRLLGMGCVSGHFFSKMFTVGQSIYELRAGMFVLGRHSGSFAVSIVDAGDTQFLGQSMDIWENLKGDPMIMGAALVNGCDPVVEPFTRTVYQSPSNALSNRNARSEEIVSAVLTESGTRTYCKSENAPHFRPSPVVIPQLASWWKNFGDWVEALLPRMRGVSPSDEMASIE